MSPSIRSIVLALVLGALLAPAAAQASPSQMSIMMDDDLLVYRDDSTAARALTQMKSLGVDTVRVTVLWETVAEFARFLKADIAKLRGEKNTRAREAARRQNARFKPANPSTYPIRNWDRYDNLVRAAAERRDQRVLQRHRARPEVGARQEAEGIHRVAADLQAQGA